MISKRYNSTYNQTGRRPLPETWDTDLLKEFDTHLDYGIFDPKDQDWDRIEREIHERFDPIEGREKVVRHFKKFKDDI